MATSLEQVLATASSPDPNPLPPPAPLPASHRPAADSPEALRGKVVVKGKRALLQLLTGLSDSDSMEEDTEIPAHRGSCAPAALPPARTAPAKLSVVSDKSSCPPTPRSPPISSCRPPSRRTSYEHRSREEEGVVGSGEVLSLSSPTTEERESLSLPRLLGGPN